MMPLLFLIYINDLPDCHLASDIILYADNTVLYYSSKASVILNITSMLTWGQCLCGSLEIS